MTDDRKQQLVSWGALASAVVMALTVGGVIVSMTLWVYAQLSTQRDELLRFRTEVAQTYVTMQGLKQLEERANQTRSELSSAIRDIRDRLDRSFDKLEKRLDQKQ